MHDHHESDSRDCCFECLGSIAFRNQHSLHTTIDPTSSNASPFSSSNQPQQRDIMASPSTSSASWDVLRRNTRNLESTIDARLTTYSSLASKIARSADTNSYSDHTALDMTGTGASSSLDHSEHLELETELESLINDLSNSVDALTSKLDDPAVPPTSAQLHAVQRHRELLFDFTRDFRRSKTNVRHAIDRRDLLGNVQGDINAYKAAHASDSDALLAERGRIDNSHSMIDRTLE